MRTIHTTAKENTRLKEKRVSEPLLDDADASLTQHPASEH